MDDHVTYITPEGLEKIKKELDHLKNTKRIEISEKLKLAIAEGDLSENANYHDAKEQQSFIEGRIRDLEDSLRRVQVIKETKNPGNTVRVKLESEDADGTFDVIVPADVGSLDIPPQFLESGLEYKIEILTYAENGNRTIVESTFNTAP